MILAGILLPPLSMYFTLRFFFKGIMPTILLIALAPCLGYGTASITYYAWLRIFGEANQTYLYTESLLFLIFAILFAYLSKDYSSEKTTPLLFNQRAPSIPKVIEYALTLIPFTAIAVFIMSTVYRPHGRWDAFKTWNLRARFLFRGGENWRDAFDPSQKDALLDYPLMIPGSIARLWHYLGNDNIIIPIFMASAFTLSTIALVYALSKSMLPKPYPLLTTGAICGSTYFFEVGSWQYADVPVAFLMLTAYGSIYLYATNNSRSYLLLAGFAAGLCCWTKNEGLIMLLASAIFLVAVKFHSGVKKSFKPLLFFSLGALPPILTMLTFKMNIDTTNYFVSGQTLGTFIDKLITPARHVTVNRFIWPEIIRWGRGIGPLLIVYSFIHINKSLGEHNTAKSCLLTLTLLLCAYYCIYVTTVLDIRFHIDSSLARLLVQIWPTFVLSTIILIAGHNHGTKESKDLCPDN